MSAFADHSSWDMVWLRIDYNGHGFDAFVTDANLARIRVSSQLPPLPAPDPWTHLALAWDETAGISSMSTASWPARQTPWPSYDAGLDQFGPHHRGSRPRQVQSAL